MTLKEAGRRTLIDVTHPAHALRYLPIAEELDRRGFEVLMVGREKDVTRQILESGQARFIMLPSRSPGPAAGVRPWRLLGELLFRVHGLRQTMRTFSPSVILTSNPSGAMAGRSFGVPVIFDTNDGTAAGPHHYLAVPFADVVTSPIAVDEDLGPKHFAYRSWKSLAWLHPDRFDPSEAQPVADLGLSGPYVLLRVVAHAASHDRGVAGIDAELLRTITEVAFASGLETVVSAETQSAGIRTSPVLRAHPERMPAIISGAALVVTDSASVAEEASMLGVPAFRVCAPQGRRRYLDHLEARYGLGRNFMLEERATFLSEIESATQNFLELQRRTTAARREMLKDHHDGVSWYADLAESVALSDRRRGVEVRALLRQEGFDERIARRGS